MKYFQFELKTEIAQNEPQENQPEVMFHSWIKWMQMCFWMTRWMIQLLNIKDSLLFTCLNESVF